MGRAARLWAANADLASAAVDHPFVRAIRDGSLPAADFAHFLAQDGAFLEAYARSYALALAHSDDRRTLLAFADLLAGVRDELAMQASYTDEGGGRVPAAPATLAYTEFLLATAALGDVATTCAAMTPCMRLYAHLGQAMAPDHSPVYAEWVATYAAPGFEALAVTLEDLLDRHTGDDTRLAETYRRAMLLELAFFDAAGTR